MFELLSRTRISPSAITLSPSQLRAEQDILRGLDRGDYFSLLDLGSDGKTTVLRHVHAKLGGAFIGVRQFLKELASLGQDAIEEAFLAMLDRNMAEHDLVIVDDLHLVKEVVESCDYIRKGLLNVALTAALESAAAMGKKLLFSSDEMPMALSRRGHSCFIQDFASDDFAAICGAYIEPAICRSLDFAEIYRFAPGLSAHQLRKAAVWLSYEEPLTTTCFVEYLREHNLVSNVEIKEVEHVTWNDLKGIDDIIRELEIKIALPFENGEWAARLQLKPKRGVLLAGPPGTGKTTIGRALAHRLKGKFFLVDGTAIAGTHRFYDEIDRVFDAARRNAPSIVFIDDADVIFGGNNDKESGLYRYLLTKLDGLESASSSRVCVMMTAMEPADIPIALLRSGRIELWLDTRLPDEAARKEIFGGHLAALPPPLCDADFARLASASRTLTGADLKAAIEDGKLLFASDQIRGNTGQPVEQYFLNAVAAIRQNRKRYQKRKASPLIEQQPIGFGAPSHK